MEITRTVRIVTLGNTYGHDIGLLPPGDILIHTGNFTDIDEYDALLFINWLESQPYNYKIILSGVSESIKIKKLIMNCASPNIIYLDGATTIIYGLRIHSVTKLTDVELTVSDIDTNYDIIVSNLPPHGLLDEDEFNVNMGSKRLGAALVKYPPRVVICGSVSYSNGVARYKNTTIVNSALYYWSSMRKKYIRGGSPIVVDITI